MNSPQSFTENEVCCEFGYIIEIVCLCFCFVYLKYLKNTYTRLSVSENVGIHHMCVCVWHKLHVSGGLLNVD